VSFEFFAVALQQAGPIETFGHDRFFVVRRLRLLVGHFQKEQKRDLLDVSHVGKPIIGQDMGKLQALSTIFLVSGMFSTSRHNRVVHFRILPESAQFKAVIRGFCKTRFPDSSGMCLLRYCWLICVNVSYWLLRLPNQLRNRLFARKNHETMASSECNHSREMQSCA